jgi:hypothetical protein
MVLVLTNCTERRHDMETKIQEARTAEPKEVVKLEIRKLDKLETTYVRNCTG